MFFDIYYIILVLPAALFAGWASLRVNSTYNKYSRVKSSKGIIAADVSRSLLDSKGLYDVKIEQTKGNLTDHYDPSKKVIRLSETVYNNTSVAAIGVACHEAGHALQYANDYSFIKLRSAILPVTKISSNLALPLVMIGIFFSSSSNNLIWVSYLGIFGFLMAAIFQLVTLPAEFDASKRALVCMLDGGYLTNEEVNDSKRVLDAAALTYVAALAVSIMSFLRFALIVFSRRD